MFRRVLFCFFWFGIFWIALLTIGGGIATSTAGAKPALADTRVQQGAKHSGQIGVAEGIAFREQYGTWVLAAAAVLAVAGTVSQILPGTRR